MITQSRNTWLVAAALLGACSSSNRPSPEHATREPANTNMNRALVTNEQTVELDCGGDGTIHFASGSAELSQQDRDELNSLASCLIEHKIDTVYITGMTDPVGSEEANRDLGERRAQAVAAYLQAIGCDERFVIRSAGENQASEAAVLWPQERRALIEAATTQSTTNAALQTTPAQGQPQQSSPSGTPLMGTRR